MQLSHSAKNSLTSFFISIHTKCWIFFHQLCNSHTHFINVSLCFRLNCNGNYRLRDEHVLQCDWMIFITKRIPCFDLFKTNCCTDITRLNKINWILLVGKHLHNTADTLFFTTAYVKHIRTCIQTSRISTEERQTTYKGVSHDLESKGRKWLFWISFTKQLFTSIWMRSFCIWNIYR